MKKILGGIVAVLIVAGLAAPFVSGVIMERVVRGTFDNLNQMYADSGHDISAEVVRYDKGYGSSDIEWRVSFGKMKNLYNIDEVIFVDHATHGWTGIESTTSLTKNKWYADFINDKLGGKDPLHITTRYTITGEVENTTAIDAFTIQTENESVAVRPGKVEVTCDKEFKDFSSRASWEGLTVDDNATLENLFLQADLSKISTYIWDGDVKFTMDKSTSKGETEAQQFALAGLIVDYALNYNREGNILSATASYGADNLTAGPETFNNLFARFSISGLQGDRYEEFMKLYTVTMSSILEDMGGAKDDPEAMSKVLEEKISRGGFQIVAAGEKLLSRGLTLHISDLRLKMAEGDINGDIMISLKKDMTFAQFIPVVNQPALALDILSLKSSASLPAVLIADNPMLFSPIYEGMQTGLFIEEGDIARHEAETRDGKLYINNQEVILQ